MQDSLAELVKGADFLHGITREEEGRFDRLEIEQGDSSTSPLPPPQDGQTDTHTVNSLSL